MNDRIAQEGYWLTQATITDETERTFERRVCRFGDLDALYMEWTDEQKEAYVPQIDEEEITAEEALNIIIGE